MPSRSNARAPACRREPTFAEHFPNPGQAYAYQTNVSSQEGFPSRRRPWPQDRQGRRPVLRRLRLVPTAGDNGTATAGDSGTATAGYSGTATAGEYGSVAILYYDRALSVYRRRIAEVAKDGPVKPWRRYTLSDTGEWIEGAEVPESERPAAALAAAIAKAKK